MIIHLIAGLIKKIWCDSNVRVKKTLVALQCMKMSKFFPKLYKPFARGINVKLGLSNYATKTDIKNISHVDTSGFALKTNLATLKTEVDKLNIDKLVPVPVDLSKLSDLVKNDVVKKTLYDKLVAKANKMDTSGFMLKTKYDTDKWELENKIPSDLVKKADYNSKITEIENKIPDVSNLATKTALTTEENKIPSVCNLVKKQIITLKLQKLKINLIITIMINILLLQNLIL